MPTAKDLQNRLLGEIYGSAGVFIEGAPASVQDIYGIGTTNNFDKLKGGNGNIGFGITKPISNDFGKGLEAVHAQYPDEIEYYACAFELINSSGETEDFFSFPVMPSQISQNRQTNTSIKKTMAGVVISNNPTFVPFDISLSGNFGRTFRAVSKASAAAATGGNGTLDGSTTKTNNLDPVVIKEKSKNIFSSDYKTGYGNCKVLENLILKSQTVDAIYGSYKLIFYNLSFNSRYLVEPLNFGFSQDKGLTRIWQYNISLKAVAPAEAVLTQEKLKTSLQKMLSFAAKNNKFSKDNLLLNDLLNPDGQTTQILRVLVKQAQSKSLGTAANNKILAKNGIQIVNNLMSNPNSISNIVVNSGGGLLNLFK